MALSHTLELTAGPALVQAAGYLTPYAQTVSAMRGTAPAAVQCVSAGVPANLPTGAILFYGLKSPTALKGPWLALCQLAAVDLVNSPGLWRGNLPLNNVAMRAAMHADINDATPEVANLPCLAELYYTLPAVDGVTPDPVGSINFNFSVGAPLVNDTENIAPDPNTPFPSAAALTAAIALGMFPGLTNMILVGYQFGNVFFTQVNSGLADEGQDTQATFVAGGSMATLLHARYAYAFDTLAGAPAIIDGTTLTGELGPVIYLDYVPSLQVRNFANATGISFQQQSTSSFINSLSISGCPQVRSVYASNAFGNSAAVGVCIQAVAAFAQATHANSSAQGTNGTLDVTNNPDIPTDAATTAALATLSSLGWSVASGQAG